jgi:hypothetical protein
VEHIEQKNRQNEHSDVSRKELFLDNGEGRNFSVGYKETEDMKRKHEQQLPEKYGQHKAHRLEKDNDVGWNESNSNSNKGNSSQERKSDKRRMVSKQGGKQNAVTQYWRPKMLQCSRNTNHIDESGGRICVTQYSNKTQTIYNI